MSDLIGSIVILIGAVFLLLAAIGTVRMPDIYNRIQTGTKATTLGLVMVLVGVAIYHPGWTWKLIVLIYFVILSNPATSHALARAAHRRSIFKTSATVVDELESYKREAGEEEIEESLEQSEC